MAIEPKNTKRTHFIFCMDTYQVSRKI